MKVYKNLKSYTIISNEIFKHELSLKAIGLYTYLVNKPDGWEFSLSGMSAQMIEGKDSIRSAIKELEEKGFIERNNNRNVKGRFSSGDYLIHGSPCGVIRDGLSNTDNPTQVNTKEVKTNKVKKYIKSNLEDYQLLVKWWNKKLKTRFKAGENGLDNYTYWSKLYSDWEIKSAILIASKHDFWSGKMTPTILFRQTNPTKDPVDYIGQVMAYKSTDPTILRIKKAMKEMGEKE